MGLAIFFSRSYFSEDTVIDGEIYNVKHQKTEQFNASIYEQLIDYLSYKISDYGIVNCMNYEFQHDLLPDIIEFCSEQLSESVEVGCESTKDDWSVLIDYLKKEQTWFEQNYDRTEAIMTFSIWF
jgi:hypothetical protein